MDKVMHIAYCSSDLYAEVCGISMLSLCENNRWAEAINFHIVEDQISDANKKRLTDIASGYGRAIEFIKMPDPAVFFHDARLTFEMLGRSNSHMMLASLLPDAVSRVLCLDSDTLILGSLDELWNTDLGENWMAGVVVGNSPKFAEMYFGIKEDAVYCSGGLFLTDLRIWRRENLEGRLRDILVDAADRGKQMHCNEEEAINKACIGRMLKLHYKYGVDSSGATLAWREFQLVRGKCLYLRQGEFEEAVKHPSIIHANNTFFVRARMWERGSDHPYAQEYESFREKSPWSSLPMIEAKWTLKKRITKNLWHCMPRFMAMRLAGFVRNKVRPRLKRQRDD